MKIVANHAVVTAHIDQLVALQNAAAEAARHASREGRYEDEAGHLAAHKAIGDAISALFLTEAE